MWLVLLEALLALMILVFIIWWTMFWDRPPELGPDDSPSTVKDEKETSKEQDKT